MYHLSDMPLFITIADLQQQRHSLLGSVHSYCLLGFVIVLLISSAVQPIHELLLQSKVAQKANKPEAPSENMGGQVRP